MSFRRYPEYKDSGVEWLGEVPRHWDIPRLKQVGNVAPSNVDKKSYDNQLPVRLCNYTDVYYNDQITADLSLMEATATLEQVSKFSLRAGDVVVTKDSETADDIAVSAFVPADLPGIVCGYHLALVRPHSGTGAAYLKRFFDSAFARASFAVRANGLTRVGLGQYDLDNVALPWPSAEERVAISSFLDRETAKIDALIAEQERLIELLKEKRQAVISHAVTKGIKPEVPMRSSGVDWLGDVPAHWGFGALTRIADRVVVGIAEAATHAYTDEGVPILRSTNIRAGQVVGEVLRIDAAFALQRGSKELRTGDLVTVRTGNAGVTAVVPPELDGCQCFTMLITTLAPGAIPEFYCYWMNSMPAQAFFNLEGWGTAQMNISVPILKSLPVPIPPPAEQNLIVDFLNHEVGRLDGLAERAQLAVRFFQERRTALISAAVTGQIDVRGH